MIRGTQLIGLVTFLMSVAALGCGVRSRPATRGSSPTVSIAELKTDCDRGRSGACEMLATCYSVGACFGNGPPQVYVDRRLSGSYVARACELGHLDACAAVGAVGLTGHGLARAQAAFHMIVMICERGSSAGCGHLADAYENGWGTSIDLDKARAAYGKQCAIDSTECQGISEPCSVNTSGCEARERVRSRPTADYRSWRAGTDRSCPIHGVAMLEDRVPIVHGLGSERAQRLDEQEGAPFANTYVPAGCMSSIESPKAAWVYYCPECRRRKHALAWHPPNEPPILYPQSTGSAAGGACGPPLNE
jgi:hypothetical protein